MYVAKILGKVVKLSNKDFKKILRKYDITNAVKCFTVNDEERWEVKIECPLCQKSLRCSGCPFLVFRDSVSGTDHSPGCCYLIQRYINQEHKIHASRTFLETIRDTINTEKIRRFLLSKFKKVK